jgi:hypothetical protein
MTVTAKVLVPTRALPTAATAVYGCLVQAAIFDKITAYNTAVGAVTVTIFIGLSLVAKVMQPGETYTFPEIQGTTMGTGDSLVTVASTAGVNFRVSGREVS